MSFGGGGSLRVAAGGGQCTALGDTELTCVPVSLLNLGCSETESF